MSSWFFYVSGSLVQIVELRRQYTDLKSRKACFHKFRWALQKTNFGRNTMKYCICREL